MTYVVVSGCFALLAVTVDLKVCRGLRCLVMLWVLVVTCHSRCSTSVLVAAVDHAVVYERVYSTEVNYGLCPRVSRE